MVASGATGYGSSFRRSPVLASAPWRSGSQSVRAEGPLPISLHDLLGRRLIDCTHLVMGASEKTIGDILGSPDDMKFRSSMTLFDAVSKQEIFAEAIATFYPARKDPATIEILRTLKD